MFRLFDSVILNDTLMLSEGKAAFSGTPGTIVEILGNHEAYMIEIFGDWAVCDETGNLTKADADTPGAFRETIGVETVFPHQIRKIPKSDPIHLKLLKIMDELSENHLEEITDFAEFLYHKQHQTANVGFHRSACI